MNINLKHVLFVLVLNMVTPLWSQTDDFTKKYETFSKQTMLSYDDFRRKCNSEYAEFVKLSWCEFKAQPAILRPKEETIPPIEISEEEINKPIKNKKMPVDGVISLIASSHQPKPIAPIYENKDIVDKTFTFLYMGTTCKVRLPENLNLYLNDVSNETIAQAWKLLATNIMDNTIRDFLLLRLNMQLCDWAYLNIINTFAKAYYGNNNEATLLAAFIYSQSGYKMRLARDDGRLYLLYGSMHRVYEKGYFVIDGMNYYSLNLDVLRVEVCNYEFPQEQALSFYIQQAQLFSCQYSAEIMLKSEKYADMQLKIKVNKNLIDFYNTYPTSQLGDNYMTRWAMYANTPMAEDIKRPLYSVLKTKIKGLTEVEAVNKLLNWVQTAFVYKYDESVWGYDRVFFAEETLFYPYCDCEDRSILFTRLVRDLLGLKCILIYYPGHLASAVCFNEQVNGDYISIDGKRFIISDPTYIGAPVGLTMPQMDNKTATAIVLQ